MNNFPNNIIINTQISLKLILCLFICLGFNLSLSAQKNLPIIKAANEQSVIQDGENVKINWKLNPKMMPDIYYVNIPHKKSIVKFITDKDEISFNTKYGNTYDFVVLLNGKDRCLI